MWDKEDQKEYMKRWRVDNREQESIRARERYQRDREARLEKMREYKRKNLERIRKQQRETYGKDPEKARTVRREEYQRRMDRIRSDPAALDAKREVDRAKMRVYYHAHKQERRLYQRAYKLTNRDRINARDRANYDPLREKLYRDARRAHGPVTRAMIQEVQKRNREQFGVSTCYLCLQPLNGESGHIEHKTPLSRGGTNVVENMDLAHQLCNLSKGAMTYDEWLKSDLAQVRSVR